MLKALGMIMSYDSNAASLLDSTNGIGSQIMAIEG